MTAATALFSSGLITSCGTRSLQPRGGWVGVPTPWKKPAHRCPCSPTGPITALASRWTWDPGLREPRPAFWASSLGLFVLRLSSGPHVSPGGEDAWKNCRAGWCSWDHRWAAGAVGSWEASALSVQMNGQGLLISNLQRYSRSFIWWVDPSGQNLIGAGKRHLSNRSSAGRSTKAICKVNLSMADSHCPPLAPFQCCSGARGFWAKGL